MSGLRQAAPYVRESSEGSDSATVNVCSQRNAATSRASLPTTDHSRKRIHGRFPDLDPELSLYRPRTLTLLRRYLQLSSAIGRLPSVIARECFRARVTSYRMQTFEDSIIFVLDMERCLAQLQELERMVITRIILQGHSHHSAARQVGCTRKTITRTLCVAIDHLSEQMLARGLLQG